MSDGFVKNRTYGPLISELRGNSFKIKLPLHIQLAVVSYMTLFVVLRGWEEFKIDYHRMLWTFLVKDILLSKDSYLLSYLKF